MTMRIAPLVFVVASLSACAGGPAAPTDAGTAMNVAGTWNGTIASSNNATMQLGMALSQSGSDVTGTWQSTTVSWSGEVSGSVSGSTFAGVFKFSGTAGDGTVCTGTATVTGPATASTMTLTSANGVVGGPCPAPLPTGVTIAVQRSSVGS
jgi:hypothetical protein